MKIRLLVIALIAIVPLATFGGYLVGYIHAEKVTSVGAAAYSSERALFAARLIREHKIDRALTVLESHGINYGHDLLNQDVSIVPNSVYIKMFFTSFFGTKGVDSLPLVLRRAQNNVNLYTANYPQSSSSIR